MIEAVASFNLTFHMMIFTSIALSRLLRRIDKRSILSIKRDDFEYDYDIKIKCAVTNSSKHRTVLFKVRQSKEKCINHVYNHVQRFDASVCK